MAGVLAVGMIPAAGFAAEAADDEASEGADVELFTAEEFGMYAGGEVNTVSILGAAATEAPANITVNYDASYAGANPVLPVTIAATEPGYNDLTVSKNGTLLSDYSVAYIAKANYDEAVASTSTTAALIAAIDTNSVAASVFMAAPGDYVAVVGNNGTFSSATMISAPLAFSVVGTSLQAAQLYTGSDPANTATSFVYTGTAYDDTSILVSLNGVALTKDTDYSISFVYANDSSTTATVQNKGNYIAKITGLGQYADSSVSIPFTIRPIQISQSTIVLKALTTTDVATISGASAVIESIDGVTVNSTIDGMLNFSTTAAGATETGQYKMSVSPKNTAGENITGSVTNMPIYVVANAGTTNGANAMWAGASVGTAGGASNTGITVILTDENKSIIPATDISVAYGASQSKTLSTNGYTMSIVNKATKQAVSNLNAQLPAGKYTCTITIDPAKASAAGTSYPVYQTAGTIRFDINVMAGTVASATDIFVSYNGEVKKNFTGTDAFTYTGKNFIEGIKVLVKDNNGDVVDPQYYTVKYMDSAKAKEVTEFVDAATYNVVVALKPNAPYTEGSGFSSNNTCAVQINPLALTADNVRLSKTGQVTNTVSSCQGYAYPSTGNAITPTLEYAVVDAKGKATGEWATLPTSQYKATYTYSETLPTGAGASATKVDKPGYYGMNLDAPDTTPTPQNFTIASAFDVKQLYNGLYNPNFSLVVISTKIFVDVPADSWEEPYVYAANAAGYMRGLGDTNTFGPNMPILRSDIAVVLYRMAGGDIYNSDGNVKAPLYAAPFNDVTDSGSYFFNSVGWLKQAKITTGTGDTGDYEPGSTLTREQFATMMLRYAKYVGTYTAPTQSTDSILADFQDGAQVSDWARDAVAWCISEGMISGVGGQKIIAPANNITRAEVAKISTIYQPQALELIK